MYSSKAHALCKSSQTSLNPRHLGTFSLINLYVLGNQGLRGTTPLTHFGFSLYLCFLSASGWRGIVFTCANYIRTWFRRTAAQLYLGCLARQKYPASLKKEGGEAEEIVQLVYCLTCKQEFLGSISRTWKAGVVGCACNPSTGEVGMGRSLGLPD